VAPQRLTVADYLDGWLQGHAVGLKPSTAQSYRAVLARYVIPSIGRERLQALSPGLLSRFFKELHAHGGDRSRPLSPRTVEYVRAVLRRAMQDAVLDRLLEVNPVVGTKPPRTVKPKHTTWTGAQLHAFLEGLDPEDRWAPLWVLAAATGMRRGELMALRWAGLDLDGGVVHIERSVTQVGRQLIFVTPKNHERRDVALDSHTVTALRTWRKAQAAERLAWGPAYVDTDGLVFTWEDGRPVLPDFVTKAFGALTARRADVPRLVLHEVWHSHASILLRDGVPVHVVAKRLGHKDPSVTLNVYADAIPDDDGRAVDVFEGGVGSVSGAVSKSVAAGRPVATGGLRRKALTCGDGGAPPGIRTPNPVIKSHLLCH
jgi:integrase